MTTVRLKTTLFAFILLAMPFRAVAQVGEYRNEFSVGGGVGVALNSVGFTPRVPQGMHIGPTAGVTARYVCEKYYSMICSIVAEVNYTSLGWKENILDAYDQKVINPVTGNAEEYSRTITYLQVPIFAHLAWGKEHSGCNFFFRAGPQLGVMLGESTSANFNISEANMQDRATALQADWEWSILFPVWGISCSKGATIMDWAIFTMTASATILENPTIPPLWSNSPISPIFSDNY